MTALSKSAVAAMQEAATEIIQAARRGSQTSSRLFIDFSTLIDLLIKLCFHSVQPHSKTIDIKTEFSALKIMMPLGIMLPVHQALTVTLPTYKLSDYDDPIDAPYVEMFSCELISGIASEAEILPFLQRPKKVVFLGSDGLRHPFLCKPKDDLRTDARMMEFASLTNRLFSEFLDSRRRKLYIRSFAVIPLTEDCGMIEWVPHTRGLRSVLQ